MVPPMTTISWPPRERTGLGATLPQRYAVDSTGRRVAFVRELATQDGYRVSLFPDGNRSHSIEGRVPHNEEFAIKMATRWLSRQLA